VNYLKPSGAIGFYYPDWVVVQKTPEGDVGWIVETKGRVWEDTAAKDVAITHWSELVTSLTGHPWRFGRVNQAPFTKAKPKTFASLVPD
jgi:type III restriction enzyme